MEIKKNLRKIYPVLEGGGQIMDGQTNRSPKELCFDRIKEAFELLPGFTPSRELSLVKTKLEEAMMWLNKDRTITGDLKPNDTHVA